MKIEKLTENKIRIIVQTDELSNCDIDPNNFMINNISSQKFFLYVLDKAEKEIGFYTKDCKLLIEAFFSLDDVFVFTITKYSIKKKKQKKYTKKAPLIKNPIYRFSSFEEFCELCEALYKSDISLTGISKRISLYLYNDTYYLILSSVNLAYRDFKKLFSMLNEFAHIMKSSAQMESRLLEYGKPIIKQNALKTGIKYFV